MISLTLTNMAHMSALSDDQHHLSPLTGLTWGPPVTAPPGAADQQDERGAPQPD